MKLVAAGPTIFRVGRLPDPFAWRSRSEQLRHGDAPVLGGNRWDDARAVFGTTYAAGDAAGAFAESIAGFRSRPGLTAAILESTAQDAPDPRFDPPLVGGVLPESYFEQRALGRARMTPEQRVVDVAHPDTWHYLNLHFGHHVRRFGFDGYDRGVVMSQDRRITRPIASYLHAALPRAVGIRYESRFLTADCFALWERAHLASPEVDPVVPETPELRRAAAALHVALPPF
jgi:RES domain